MICRRSLTRSSHFSPSRACLERARQLVWGCHAVPMLQRKPTRIELKAEDKEEVGVLSRRRSGGTAPSARADRALPLLCPK